MRWSVVFLIFASCNQAPSAPTPSISPYSGEYGKSGTGDYESCYVGAAGTNFRCAQVPKSDTSSINVLHSACGQYGGRLFDVACTDDGLQGYCGRLHRVPGVIVRYYGKWDKVDAQVDCGETFDGIYEPI